MRQVVILCLFAMLSIYPLDWMIWKLRTAFGVGMDTVTITNTTAASLKGNHFEVYDQSAAPAACSQSLFPQAGAGACWWLRRHPQVIQQY